MIDPVTRTPLRNLRVTPSDADSSCDTACFATASASFGSRYTDDAAERVPLKMVRNVSSARSSASAAWKSDSFCAL